MTIWSEVFLGVIAVATLMTALVQVSLIIFGWMLARRVARLVGELERDLRPAVDSINSMARDAARATALATAQVERVDKLFSEVMLRIEQTAATVQTAIINPLRDGAAIMAGVKAALAVLTSLLARRSGGSGGRGDDEDALFIG